MYKINTISIEEADPLLEYYIKGWEDAGLTS